MGIFDIFAPKPQQPAPQQQQPQQQPTPPGNIQDQPTPVTQTTPATEVNGAIPAQVPVVETPPKDDSPLADFSKLWEDVPIVEGEKPPEHTPLDPANLAKIMGKADFSKAVDADTLAAIVAGGEGAGTAFTTAMNSVVQQAMVQSTLINEKLTAQAVERAIAATEAKIPDLLRSQAAASHLKDSNPLFSNPAVKPVIDATRAQLLQKFPNDTPAETTQKLNDYLDAMSKAFNPAKADPSAESVIDWNLFLDPQSKF